MKRNNSSFAMTDVESVCFKRGNHLDSVVAALKLQNKKDMLEKRLHEKGMELKKLCLQEFELTGVLPNETPLEANENPPKIKRKMPTMFPYDEKLLKQLEEEEKSADGSPKRKALSPWNSCDNIPVQSSPQFVSPKSPKHNTWTSPVGKVQPIRSRPTFSNTFKFLKRRLQ